MYTGNFGFKKLPFENVPDPMFFFDHGDYARMRKRITESLKAGRGLVVVTGPEGSGKTTLSQMIIPDFSGDIRIIWIAEPPEKSSTLFLFVAQELGLKPLAFDKTSVLKDIKGALLKIRSESSKYLMIIEESHLLTDDTIDGICLLNSLEEGQTKLIHILLLGQKKILETIDRPEMEPFKQGIAVLEIIDKMNADTIRKYVAHRIEAAGGNASIFTDSGWKALALAFGSGNTPRTINSLCDRSLSVAFEREKTIVDVDDVYKAAEEMGIDNEESQYKAAPIIEEQTGQVPSNGRNASVWEPDVTGEPVTKADRKDIKEYCRTFLRRILDKRNGKNKEVNTPPVFIKGRETESVKETEIAETKNGKHVNDEDAAAKSEEPAATHEKVPEGFGVSSVEDKGFRVAEEVIPCSEWITVNSKGEKSFKPADVRDSTSKEKGKTAAELDKWINADEKKSNEFEFFDVEDKRYRKKEEIVNPSVWVTMDTKGKVKSFKPAGFRDKKPADKKKTAVKSDEWM
jgi:general secretion pathway protein A